MEIFQEEILDNKTLERLYYNFCKAKFQLSFLRVEIFTDDILENKTHARINFNKFNIS